MTKKVRDPDEFQDEVLDERLGDEETSERSKGGGPYKDRTRRLRVSPIFYECDRTSEPGDEDTAVRLDDTAATQTDSPELDATENVMTEYGYMRNDTRAFQRHILDLCALLPLAQPDTAHPEFNRRKVLSLVVQRFGRTDEEIQDLLSRIALLTNEDRAAIDRIARAEQAARRAATDDIKHVCETLERLGLVVDMSVAAADLFRLPTLAYDS